MPDAPTPDGSVPLAESRKFKALLLAIVVYGTPILMTFVLVLLDRAKFEDLKSMSTWMGVALSPAFMAFILGTAWEGAAASAAKRPAPITAGGDVATTTTNVTPAVTS